MGRKERRAKEVEARSLKSQSQMSYVITAIGQDIPSQIVGQKAEAKRDKGQDRRSLRRGRRRMSQLL
jgi:hypothetical protein